MRSAFLSPLIKTMVMTTGELDLDGIFHFNNQEDADKTFSALTLDCVHYNDAHHFD